ncbi:hypothetical protein U0C82_03740 [Fulvimarina sp. 2208YS6-2-32]|uniref:Head-to-tail stopper n=1 Tax=Fulvimarina uroteuthidis TaxID=3098149 RepID=A0ABU5I277_9HYPH|nr:hypothetical protein [Fulvimarina sp. 2208YS6-2-32]MDY8108261.1 hypothetical protein [Fulvimarina sp. 2208YS6-2-32]
MIDKFGGDGQILRPSTRDPYDPDGAGTTPDPLTAKMVRVEYTLGERENSLISNRDCKILVAAKGLDHQPNGSDRISFGGETYEVVNSKPLAPDGATNILFEVQARS